MGCFRISAISQSTWYVLQELIMAACSRLICWGFIVSFNTIWQQNVRPPGKPITELILSLQCLYTLASHYIYIYMLYQSMTLLYLHFIVICSIQPPPSAASLRNPCSRARRVLENSTSTCFFSRFWGTTSGDKKQNIYIYIYIYIFTDITTYVQII